MLCALDEGEYQDRVLPSAGRLSARATDVIDSGVSSVNKTSFQMLGTYRWAVRIISLQRYWLCCAGLATWGTLGESPLFAAMAKSWIQHRDNTLFDTDGVNVKFEEGTDPLPRLSLASIPRTGSYSWVEGDSSLPPFGWRSNRQAWLPLIQSVAVARYRDKGTLSPQISAGVMSNRGYECEMNS